MLFIRLTKEDGSLSMINKLAPLLIILLMAAAPVVAQVHNPKDNLVILTSAEETWLSNHKTIRVGMSPVLPPLKFSDKGVIKGIEPDYLNLLSEYTGIHFEYVICDFSGMDAKVKAGEIDMMLSFVIPERLAYMKFTEPFMEFKSVIVARSDNPFISGISTFKGKKMATVKGVKLYDKLLGPYPEIEAVPVETLEDMFKAVSESKADALITKTYLAGYLMQNYPKLKIVGVADLPPEPYLYAVRKDYPELVGILNKAIKAIPKDRFDAIVQKWFTIRLEYRPNWSEIRKWAFAITMAFTLILGLSLFWNRRLAREIAKRKQAEEALRELNVELEQRVMDRTAQLSAANREQEAFSYSISHDLRAPLRIIDGFSHALLEEYQKKPLDDTGMTYLERVRKATQRMGFLIDDLLKLSKITQSEMRHESVDLSGMIREITEAHLNNSDRAVDVTVQEEIVVRGDSHLLKIAMENLVDNAFKFTGREAHPRIEFGTVLREGKLACFIRDNGAGFEMAYAGKLFGAFQRLHKSDEFPGMGIGLATVQRIIHRHGGQIWAEGEAGKGAAFYFLLP
jgi:signal transduction histidine kinase